MNAKQEAKVNMYRAVEKHCDDNAAIIATVPAFESTFTNFKTLIADLLGFIKDEDLVTTGITTSKSDAKKNLCTLTGDLAAQVFAFATSTADVKLQSEVDFSVSDLLKTKDDQLGPRCQNIHDRANGNIVALTPFGVTVSSLSDVQSAITLYESKVPGPRNATAQKKTIRQNIKNKIKEIDNLLTKQLDKTVVAFKSSGSDFYNTYKNNRIILDPGVTVTQLSGTVTSTVDGSGIAAKIIVENTDAKFESNASGSYSAKPVTAGKTNVNVTATGFAGKTIKDVEIKLGRNNILNITMTPE